MEVSDRDLIENMVEGFAHCRIVLDADGRPVDWVFLRTNPAFEKLTGLSDLVGKSITQVIPGFQTSEPQFFELCSRVALTGQPEKREIKVESLRKWLMISVFSEAKRHFVALCEDITERKQAEKEISRKDAQVAEARRLGQLSAWQWDPHTDAVTWSEELYRLAGRDPTLPPPPFKEHSQFFTPDSWDRLRKGAENALETGAPFELELEAFGADEARRAVLVRGEVVRDASGQVTQLRGTIQNVTERKQGERALDKYKRQLEILSRASRELNAVLEIPALMRTLIQSAMELVGATGGGCRPDGGRKDAVLRIERQRAIVPHRLRL